MGRKPRQADNEGSDVRMLSVRVNPDGLLAIKRLALDLNTSVQALGVEAWNGLLKKHGKRPVVRNPLAD
jgi:antitoxin-like ribbon-helix-helix protein